MSDGTPHGTPETATPAVVLAAVVLVAMLIGGKVRKNTLVMVDAVAVAAVEPMSVDTLFISSDGFTADVGLTTP